MWKAAVKKTFSWNDGIVYPSNSIDFSTFGTRGKFDWEVVFLYDRFPLLRDSQKLADNKLSATSFTTFFVRCVRPRDPSSSQIRISLPRSRRSVKVQCFLDFRKCFSISQYLARVSYFSKAFQCDWPAWLKECCFVFIRICTADFANADVALPQIFC